MVMSGCLGNELIGFIFIDDHMHILMLCSFSELQARGLKKHMKRLNAPKHWMLDKLGGAFVSGSIFSICVAS